MVKIFWGCLLLLSVFLTAAGEENIKLHLTTGKILTVKKIRKEKNGDISFLHPQTARYMLLPPHLLVKIVYPKPVELLQADTLFQQKKYQQSALCYRKCAGITKDMPEWEIYRCFYEGKACFLAGDISGSIKALEKLPGKDVPLTGKETKEFYEGLFLLATLYSREKEFEKAYFVLDKLISSPEKEFVKKAILEKGKTFFAEEKWTHSANMFKLYKLLFPEDPEKSEADEYLAGIQKKQEE